MLNAVLATLIPAPCANDGDTSWVLLCFILVLGMMPALAFFEAGLLRSKNTLSLIAQILGGIVILSVLWDIIGFSLVFDDTHGGIIGGLRHAFLIDLSYDECLPAAPTIPSVAYAMFQMMFASITPLLLTGAYAERLSFKAFFLFTIIWEVVVYYPLAHWIWNAQGWLAQMGALDFAGGIVIHTSAGAGAIVCAIYLGKRKDFHRFHGEFPPSNIPLASIGAALLWLGWFGFNAGSSFAAGSVAVGAVVTTHLAGSASAVTWLFLGWYQSKPATVHILNGVIAGFAGITPASGYIHPQTALPLGVVFGLASYYSVHLMKHKFELDDALDVSSVHGLTGILGSLSIGLFASKVVNPQGADGLFFDGGWTLFGVQCLAVGVAAAYGGALTYVILKVLDKCGVEIRVDHDDEVKGIDFAEHGEVAYHGLVFDDPERQKKLRGHSTSSLNARARSHSQNNEKDDTAPNSGITTPAASPMFDNSSTPMVQDRSAPSPIVNASIDIEAKKSAPAAAAPAPALVSSPALDVPQANTLRPSSRATTRAQGTPASDLTTPLIGSAK